MTTILHLTPAEFAALGFAAGLALGLFYFATLRKVAALWLSGMAPGRLALIQVGRFAVVALSLAALARAGALPLLAGALGLLAGRAAVLRATREAT